MGGVVFCLCCSCALICTVALFFLFHALFATVHSKMIPNTINATLLIFFETLSRLTCPSTPHTGCSSYPRTMNTKFRHRFASRSMETKAHEAPTWHHTGSRYTLMIQVPAGCHAVRSTAQTFQIYRNDMRNWPLLHLEEHMFHASRRSLKSKSLWLALEFLFHTSSFQKPSTESFHLGETVQTRLPVTPTIILLPYLDAP
jgi:hypothetical protein